MPLADDLTALENLLHGDPSAANLPPEAAQELIGRGIVATLEEAALQNRNTPTESFRIFQILEQTTASHALDSVRGQAFQSLLRLGQEGIPQAVDALYRLAIENNLMAARQAIIARGWQPSHIVLRALFDWMNAPETGRPLSEEQLPLLTRAYFEVASPTLRRRMLALAGQNRSENWAQIVPAIENADESAMEALVERYPKFRPVEREIILEELVRLAKTTSTEAPPGSQVAARLALARLFIRHEETRAREIVLENRYLPEDPEERALLFFLAEDWSSYETLDFDQSLLASAYERAGRSLRRRLLEHGRYTGQTDWLRGLGGAGEPRLLNDLSDADWEIVLERLTENNRPVELWRLAQSAPPVWSAVILDRLVKRGWQPQTEPGTDPEEQDGFERLARLARESLKTPLTVKPTRSLYAPLTEITCLAVHPGGLTLAAGSSDQRIYQWSLPEGRLIEPPLMGPAPVTRAMAYNPEGDLLACASGDNRIRVFQARTGLLVKTFEGHQAMIRSLAVHPDGRTLFSASFDGSTRFWRFPHGAERKVLRAGPGELFSLVVAGNGGNVLAGGTDGLVYVWTFPEGAAARELAGHTGTVTHLAANPNGDLVASAGRDGMIRVWNFNSGGLLRTIPVQGTLTALLMHPNEQILVSGSSDGTITLWNLTTGRMLEQLTAHRKPVIGLALSPDGHRLYSADSGATQFASLHVWDLQLFLAARLSGEITRPGAAGVLQEQVKQPTLSPSERKWLEFSAELALWRQRFEIEIEEYRTIEIGEFDIELG